MKTFLDAMPIAKEKMKLDRSTDITCKIEFQLIDVISHSPSTLSIDVAPSPSPTPSRSAAVVPTLIFASATYRGLP
jgi:hypothetical protein